MGDENWRTEINASDYFGNQKKRVAIQQRRPVIRKASDLVGPGIAESAIRITDFDDVLATYNGYYSADYGTPGSPVSGQFIMFVSSDIELGGVQLATNLATNVQYRRTFTRNPSAEYSLTWSSWVNSATS